MNKQVVHTPQSNHLTTLPFLEARPLESPAWGAPPTILLKVITLSLESSELPSAMAMLYTPNKLPAVRGYFST